ncbi:hypothetical protein HZC07_02970, partial [Candidatus Micrarchaeota archaeon]|nr:hypothetical protein [Candidatus Micrarchaeota archaeon]
NEFNPLRFFGVEVQSKPATTASEYVGQLWGIIESHWIWSQVVRTLFAAAIAIVYPSEPGKFIPLLFTKSAEWGRTLIDNFVFVRNRVDIQKKMDENNKANGIE